MSKSTWWRSCADTVWRALSLQEMERVFANSCPECGAGAQAPCTSKKGRVRKRAARPHVARIHAIVGDYLAHGGLADAQAISRERLLRQLLARVPMREMKKAPADLRHKRFRQEAARQKQSQRQPEVASQPIPPTGELLPWEGESAWAQ
jgi:hypothetical protein